MKHEKRCSVWDYPCSTYVIFSEKLILLRYVYQGVRNESFSENFAYEVKKFSLSFYFSQFYTEPVKRLVQHSEF